MHLIFLLIHSIVRRTITVRRYCSVAFLTPPFNAKLASGSSSQYGHDAKYFVITSENYKLFWLHCPVLVLYKSFLYLSRNIAD